MTSSSEALIQRFRRVRRRTEAVARLLSPEDQQPQSMPDASPTKWHRAHTTWFFETFVLGPAGIAPLDERYGFLFNSYYDGVGPRHPRPQRGLLTRPSHDEVSAWRAHVDDAVVAYLTGVSAGALGAVAQVVSLGLAHEEQHQELIITDALHLLAQNPLRPALQPTSSSLSSSSSSSSPAFVEHAGGIVSLGRDVSDLVFDNEGPRHRVFLEPYAIAGSLVTVGAMRAFITDGGYRRPSLWLAAGFDEVTANGQAAPLYLRPRPDDGALIAMTVHGERVLADDEPLTHISYYEADALARFLGARLPTEAEWEHAAAAVADDDIAAAGFDIGDGDNDIDAGAVVSDLANASGDAGAFFGCAWQWTQSAYQAYPGFRPAEGVVGEYNGKFMVGQQVLRGSSSATPRGHARRSYRNFWPPQTRFQVAGLRLARDLPT